MVKIIRISLYDGLGKLIFEDTVTQSLKIFVGRVIGVRQ